MMAARILLICFCLFLIGGCAASTDPHEGGLLGGIVGLSSGEYERRIQERQARLQRLRAIQGGLQQETASLEARKTTLKKQLKAEKQRLSRLKRDVSALERRIKGLERQKEASSSKIKDLKARLAALKAEIKTVSQDIDALEGSGLGDTEIDIRRRQLEAQRKALQKEYESLLELTLQLGQ